MTPTVKYICGDGVSMRKAKLIEGDIFANLDRSEELCVCEHVGV